MTDEIARPLDEPEFLMITSTTIFITVFGEKLGIRVDDFFAICTTITNNKPKEASKSRVRV